MKKPILINGRKANIFYRESQSEQKDDPKIYTYDVLRVLEALLKGDRSRDYGEGITTLAELTNLDGAKMWNDSRVSNKIIELRKVIPKSALLTFYVDGGYKYALINDDEVIAFAEKQVIEIRETLGKRL